MLKITSDERWIRTKSGDWDIVPCFRFTNEDGSTSTADLLDDEQHSEWMRQEAEREPAPRVDE